MQGVAVNLLTILQSNTHKERILKLRNSKEDDQKHQKENLPCYTVAGTFNPRRDQGIVQLSGLAAVDLDSAEDYDIAYLLAELKRIPSIAYAGLSCRGKRLFCIVPFLYPDKYSQHYDRLIQSFRDYGLPMGDECHKSISQPRFITWNNDETQFFNHTATPYHLLLREKIIFSINHSSELKSSFVSRDSPFTWCNDQINKSHFFVKGERHSYIIHLARYCNIKGLTIQDTLNGCIAYAQPDFNKKEIEKIVTHIYNTQTNSHNKSPFNN